MTCADQALPTEVFATWVFASQTMWPSLSVADGIEDTEYLEVPLTTVAQPLLEMCEIACQFLEQRIEDPTRLPSRS